MRTICTITEAAVRLSPEDLAYHLKDSPYTCFLDSSLAPDKYSRFSYIGWEPLFVIKSMGIRNEFINLSRKIRNTTFMHPLDFIRQHTKRFVCYEPGAEKDIDILISAKKGGTRMDISEKYENSGIPDFIGGFLGYFSYDLKDYLERLPHTAPDDLGLPIAYHGFFMKLMAFDHGTGRWYFIRDYIQPGDDRSMEEILADEDLLEPAVADTDIMDRAASEMEKTLKDLPREAGGIEAYIRKKYLEKPIKRIRLKSNFNRRQYLERVRRTREYIYAGDIYQVNLSQRFRAEAPILPMDLYYILRKKNPAPFSAYLGFPEFSICCSSPERFLYLKDGMVETRPIKGTRPRGDGHRQDAENARELRDSIKDRAELNMIVDLERNDLGKFCYYGSVQVSQHAVIEKYARVFHSVSTVRGKVIKGTDTVDIIKAAFPGGSITGAPKIRAMEIIDELETVSRGIYTGSIGYISLDNTMDLNIVIRTFIIINGCSYYNVGGGIVADSVSRMEYRETLDKGSALQDTLDHFRKHDLVRYQQDESDR